MQARAMGLPSDGRGLHRAEQIMGMPIIADVRDPDVDPAALGRSPVCVGTIPP